MEKEFKDSELYKIQKKTLVDAALAVLQLRAWGTTNIHTDPQIKSLLSNNNELIHRANLIAYCISDTLYDTVNITVTKKKADGEAEDEAEEIIVREAQREADAIDALTVDFDLFEPSQADAILTAIKIMIETREAMAPEELGAQT